MITVRQIPRQKPLMNRFEEPIIWELGGLIFRVSKRVECMPSLNRIFTIKSLMNGTESTTMETAVAPNPATISCIKFMSRPWLFFPSSPSSLCVYEKHYLVDKVWPKTVTSPCRSVVSFLYFAFTSEQPYFLHSNFSSCSTLHNFYSSSLICTL